MGRMPACQVGGCGFEARRPLQSSRGLSSSLGERLPCKQEVAGSSPAGSTNFVGRSSTAEQRALLPREAEYLAFRQAIGSSRQRFPAVRPLLTRSSAGEHRPHMAGVAGSSPAGSTKSRGVAQSGRALGSDPRGHRFKSCLPDQLLWGVRKEGRSAGLWTRSARFDSWAPYQLRLCSSVE